jgi:energy-converting hydrogenase Eha subunit A
MPWWPQIGDELRQGSVRVRLQRGLTRHLSENAMAVKMKPQRAKHKKSKASPTPVYAASTLSVAGQNLINMVVVYAISGTVLLGLLAAKHF